MIYVDELIACVPSRQWPYDRSCHLFTDGDVEELHEFAKRIGLKRSWFQNTVLPHYDLTKSNRAAAVRAGAIESSRQKTVECIRAFRRLRNGQR